MPGREPGQCCLLAETQAEKTEDYDKPRLLCKVLGQQWNIPDPGVRAGTNDM